MSYEKLKILSVDYWDTQQVKELFLRRLQNESFDKIFIFTQNEWALEKIFGDHFFPFLGTYIEYHNLNVDLITSLPKQSYNSKTYRGLNIHHWDTYWLSKTYSLLNTDWLKVQRTEQEETFTELKYPYIMMNNRSHKFRAMLVDQLAKSQILDLGAVSWNDTDSFLLDDYQFTHFDGKKRILDEKYFTDQGGQYSPPNEYFMSFAQLISESTPRKVFFSEKISMALLLGKPFLAAASVGIHKYLHDKLGIEYYDEIFDYSFDMEHDMERRWQLIVDNFVRLSKHSLPQLEELKRKLHDKVMYNKNRAEEIIRNVSFMPHPIIDYFMDYKNSTWDHRVHLNRHLSMIFETLL